MFGSHGPKKSGAGKTRYRVKLDIGKSMVGWLVGPIIGLQTHYLNSTRPCREDVTRGRMNCYCKRMKLESVWKGYVPLIDRDGVHCFVQICDTYAELAYKVRVFSPVKVTRMTHRGSPYAVKEDDWTDADPRSRFDFKRPFDVRPWLLKLWGDDELTKWLAEHPEVTDQEQQPGELERRVGPMLKAAARKVESVPDVASDAFAEVLARSVSKNGKH